jgi:hypothetical protein
VEEKIVRGAAELEDAIGKIEGRIGQRRGGC